MPTKEVTVPSLGTLILIKRKGSRSIRLSVTPEGQIRVSLPTWVPYQAGITFANSKADWIAKQRLQTRRVILKSGQPLGKAHHLYFNASLTASTITSRLKATQAVVTYPQTLAPNDPQVQKVARQVAIRALRSEAEALLPKRLQSLAQQGGFGYASVQVKQLKRRWGSCNQRGEITLNLFLMQLPWQLIDYVIWHELTHTKHMDHGVDFWSELTGHLPQAKQLRKQIHEYNTDIR